MTSRTSAAAVLAWSESTPIASLPAGLGRGEDTATRTTGRLVDDVGAALVHALGGRLALVDRVEAREVRRLGEVLGVDDDVRVDRLGAGLVARLELLDEVGVDAADEADVVDLRLQGRRRADEVGALLLGEGDLVDVRARRVGRRVVDDGELDVRVGLGRRTDGLRVGEADGDDVGVAGVDELLETLQASRLGLTVGRRGLLGLDAELLDGLVETRRRGVVERLVATAAHVVGHADLEARAAGAAGGRAAATARAAATVRAATTRGQRHGSDRHGRRELHHLTHNENSFGASGRTGVRSARSMKKDTAALRPSRPEVLLRVGNVTESERRERPARGAVRRPEPPRPGLLPPNRAPARRSPGRPGAGRRWGRRGCACPADPWRRAPR